MVRYSLILLLLLPSLVSAENTPNLKLSIKPVYDAVDVEGADFDGSLFVEGTLIKPINDRFSVEASFTGLDNAETSQECDNTGCYKISLNSLEVLFGGRYQFHSWNKFGMYARGGALFYNAEVELEEEFYNLKPGGKDSASDNGLGFYLGGGVSMNFSQDLSLLAELMYRTRFDMLGDSSSPFDINSIGFGVGCQWQW